MEKRCLSIVQIQSYLRDWIKSKGLFQGLFVWFFFNAIIGFVSFVSHQKLEKVLP